MRNHHRATALGVVGWLALTMAGSLGCGSGEEVTGTDEEAFDVISADADFIASLLYGQEFTVDGRRWKVGLEVDAADVEIHEISEPAKDGKRTVTVTFKSVREGRGIEAKATLTYEFVEGGEDLYSSPVSNVTTIEAKKIGNW